MTVETMPIALRPETEEDYRIVEELTREAFWNVHYPGCDEHLLVHKLRNANAFVRDLDFAAVYNNEVAGNIMYTETKIKSRDREYTVLTFGPVSVLPKYQGRGIGAALIEHTKKAAAAMGYRAIVIYGDPDYYRRFGFTESKSYRITNEAGKYPAAMLAAELYPGALDGIEGTFDDGGIYQVDEKELPAFEQGFPPREKHTAASQERFKELAGKYL